MMEYTLIPHNWNFVELSIHFGSGMIPGGKEYDKARQAVFFCEQYTHKYRTYRVAQHDHI